jgi:hypothetical protein
MAYQVFMYCWSLLLAVQAHSNGHSQVNLGEWNSILIKSCITSIPVIIPSLFMSTVDDSRVIGNEAN